MAEHVAELSTARWTHGTEGHGQVAYGRDARGASRAREASAYPAGMNVAIARTMRRAAAAAAAGREQMARGEVYGGRVAEGPG
eukprot:5047452-Pleurochrysis_carterae.AAC.1